MRTRPLLTFTSLIHITAHLHIFRAPFSFIDLTMVSGLVRDSLFGKVVRIISNNRVFQYPEEIDPTIWHQYINPVKSRNLALYGTPEPHPLETAEDFLERPIHEHRLTPEEIASHDRGQVVTPKALESGLSPVNPAGLNPKTEPYHSQAGYGGAAPVTDTSMLREKPEGTGLDASQDGAEAEGRPSSVGGRPPSSRESETTRVEPNPGQPYMKNEDVNAERGKDVLLVDWLPNDPEVRLFLLLCVWPNLTNLYDVQNPLNWSQAKKLWVTFELCLLTFSVYIGSAIYSAGIEDVTRVFHVSEVAATLGLTLFVAYVLFHSSSSTRGTLNRILMFSLSTVAMVSDPCFGVL